MSDPLQHKHSVPIKDYKVIHKVYDKLGNAMVPLETMRTRFLEDRYIMRGYFMSRKAEVLKAMDEAQAIIDNYLAD